VVLGPIDSGLNAQEMTVRGGPISGTAYAAVYDSGNAYFLTTTDSGSTWSTPTLLGSAGGSDLSIDFYQDNIYVAVQTGSVTIYTNKNRGVCNDPLVTKRGNSQIPIHPERIRADVSNSH
jgi:photosystem II stability/assembly factor-like uncharacterized protein